MDCFGCVPWHALPLFVCPCPACFLVLTLRHHPTLSSLSSLLLQYWTCRCYSSCILHVAVLVSEDGNKGGSRCGITMDRQHQRHFREDPSAERWSWQQDPLIDRLFDHKDSATPQRTLMTTTTTATVPRYEMLHPSCVYLSPFPPLLSLSLSLCLFPCSHAHRLTAWLHQWHPLIAPIYAD